MKLYALNKNHGCDFMAGIQPVKHDITSDFFFLHTYLEKEVECTKNISKKDELIVMLC